MKRAVPWHLLGKTGGQDSKNYNQFSFPQKHKEKQKILFFNSPFIDTTIHMQSAAKELTESTHTV